MLIRLSNEEAQTKFPEFVWDKFDATDFTRIFGDDYFFSTEHPKYWPGKIPDPPNLYIYGYKTSQPEWLGNKDNFDTMSLTRAIGLTKYEKQRGFVL